MFQGKYKAKFMCIHLSYFDYKHFQYIFNVSLIKVFEELSIIFPLIKLQKHSERQLVLE